MPSPTPTTSEAAMRQSTFTTRRCCTGWRAVCATRRASSKGTGPESNLLQAERAASAPADISAASRAACRKHAVAILHDTDHALLLGGIDVAFSLLVRSVVRLHLVSNPSASALCGSLGFRRHFRLVRFTANLARHGDAGSRQPAHHC